MSKKTAVLLDLGFATRKLKRLLGAYPTATDIHSFALKCLNQPDEELFRLYCYDCLPYGKTETHPLTKTRIDFAKTKQFRERTKLITALKITDNVAFRAGELSFQGWRLKAFSVKDILKTGRALADTDFEPDLSQKSVDMKIGLDVAWLSSKNIVEKIVLVAADSDFIPPMKFARREGVQIILVTLGHTKVKPALIEHCDELRAVVFP